MGLMNFSASHKIKNVLSDIIQKLTILDNCFVVEFLSVKDARVKSKTCL